VTAGKSMSKCSSVVGIALGAIIPWHSAVAQPTDTDCECRGRFPFPCGSGGEARAIIRGWPTPTIWVSGEVLESKDIRCGKRLSILVRKRLSPSVTLSSPSLGEQIDVDVSLCVFSWNGKVGDVIGMSIFQMPDPSGTYHPFAC